MYLKFDEEVCDFVLQDAPFYLILKLMLNDTGFEARRQGWDPKEILTIHKSVRLKNSKGKVFHEVVNPMSDPILCKLTQADSIKSARLMPWIPNMDDLNATDWCCYIKYGIVPAIEGTIEEKAFF